MTIAHGSGAQQHDELLVVAVLMIVLALAVLQVRWKAHQRAALTADAEAAPSAEMDSSADGANPARCAGPCAHP